MCKEEILKKCEENFDYIVRIRRELHKIPGIGFENTEAISFIKNELEKIGIKANLCGKCGIVADIGKGETDKCILLRADSDALAICEEADLDFKSNNGNMHACGHDMHCAMLLGCAKILKEYEDEISGTVRLVFQSAEETLEGALDVIQNGVLENPKPNFAMMIHVMTAIPLECGALIVSSEGVSAPSADFFEIEVNGKACHGSTPSDGIDPIYVGANIVTALSEISSRELLMKDRAALTIGFFNAGKSANAIPQKAVLKGSLRTFNEELRSKVKERTVQICNAVAQTYRASVNVRFTSGCPTLLNDKEVSNKLFSYATELFEKNIYTSDSFSNKDGASSTQGSEDFAYISHEVSSCMLALAAGNSLEGYEYPLHNPKVRFDENALKNGSAILSFCALRECGNTNKY